MLACSYKCVAVAAPHLHPLPPEAETPLVGVSALVSPVSVCRHRCLVSHSCRSVVVVCLFVQDTSTLEFKFFVVFPFHNFHTESTPPSALFIDMGGSYPLISPTGGANKAKNEAQWGAGFKVGGLWDFSY